MKKAILISFLVVLVCLTSACKQKGFVADESGFVTSERLTIDDVKPFMDVQCEEKGLKVITIYGIHQEQNRATVFFLAGQGTKSWVYRYGLVRLDSGKWFHPESKTNNFLQTSYEKKQ